MTFKITKEQYDKLADAITAAEENALDGTRSQVQYNPADGSVWVSQLRQNEVYDGAPYIEIFSVEPHTLKDLFGDGDDAGVDWEDENYKESDGYQQFREWYFDDNADGFKVCEILNESLERHGIEVKGE